MPKRRTKGSNDACGECCSVQALVRIDERGQMVLPKDVRERAGLRGGDKLALSMIEKDGRVCCLVLTRADDLGVTVRGMLGLATGGREDE
ncbi:MAG: HgcAB-associated protein [Candidatus Bipolaricaulota bacterium]|nr:HgcAB-associated protein [Candidatus Bipolaricaulota bacterium]